MKVHFVTPPYHCGVLECAGSWIPLHLVHLAGAVERAGHRASIHDAMTRFEGIPEILDRIREEAPDVVGVGAVTAQYPAAAEVLRAVKAAAPRAVTLLGGVHGTFMWRDVLEAEPSIDAVVVGEGEATMADLLHALETGSSLHAVPGVAARDGDVPRCGPPRGFLADLDDLPAAWHLLPWEDYTYAIWPGSRLGAVSSSRGCGHACSFCSQQRFWDRTWRARSPGAFVADVAMLARRYRVDTLLVPDEHPTSDRARWAEILEGILRADLGVRLLMETRAEDVVRDADLLPLYRRAGVVHIYVGLEATDQGRLDAFGKGLTTEISRAAIRRMAEAGIVSETSFILGTPDETPESIEATYAASLRYDPDFAHFLAVAPWPYSPLHGEMGGLVEVRDWSAYNLVTPVARSHAMSRDEIFRALLSCYRRFYMRRLARLDRIRDPFRRDYLVRSMRAMLRSSFLKEHLGGLGRMPAAVERALRFSGLLEAPADPHAHVADP